jgi:hypothetical protein
MSQTSWTNGHRSENLSLIDERPPTTISDQIYTNTRDRTMNNAQSYVTINVAQLASSAEPT